jgi:hypothetical protein
MEKFWLPRGYHGAGFHAFALNKNPAPQMVCAEVAHIIHDSENAKMRGRWADRQNTRKTQDYFFCVLLLLLLLLYI